MTGGRRWMRAAGIAPVVALLLAGAIACGGSPPPPVPSGRPSAAVGGAGANPWLHRHVVAVTHNGGQFEVPQDTLYGLHRMQAVGAQVLDVDVQLSSDGVPVLIHSADLSESTDGSGPASAETARQLGRLDAAYQWVPGCGACAGRPVGDYPLRGVRVGARPLPGRATSRAEFGVPTLRQVFTQFPQATLDIELKPESDAAAQVAALISRFGRADRTIVASFDDRQVAQFHALAPTVAVSPGQQASEQFVLGAAMPTGFQVLQLPYRYDLGGREVTVITPSLVQRAHAAGLAVWVWDEGATPGRPLYRTLVRLGVDGILASRPSQLLAVLHDSHTEWSG